MVPEADMNQEAVDELWAGAEKFHSFIRNLCLMHPDLCNYPLNKVLVEVNEEGEYVR